MTIRPESILRIYQILGREGTHFLYRVLGCVILQTIARCFIRYISKPLQKRQKGKHVKLEKRGKSIWFSRSGSPTIHLNSTHVIKATIPWPKTSQRHRKTENKIHEPPLLNFNWTLAFFDPVFYLSFYCGHLQRVSVIPCHLLGIQATVLSRVSFLRFIDIEFILN